MIRGLVPKDRLLEWCVQDGWGPLCEFLGKPVPDEPFPHVNTAAAFAEHVDRRKEMDLRGTLTDFAVMFSVLIGVLGVVYTLWHCRTN